MDAFAKLPDAIAELVAEFSSTPVVGDLNVGLTQYSLWLLIAGVVLLAVIFAFVMMDSTVMGASALTEARSATTRSAQAAHSPADLPHTGMPSNVWHVTLV